MTITPKPFKPRMRFNIYGVWQCWGKDIIAVSRDGNEAYEHWKTRAAAVAAGRRAHGLDATRAFTVAGEAADGRANWGRHLRRPVAKDEDRA